MNAISSIPVEQRIHWARHHHRREFSPKYWAWSAVSIALALMGGWLLFGEMPLIIQAAGFACLLAIAFINQRLVALGMRSESAWVNRCIAACATTAELERVGVPWSKLQRVIDREQQEALAKAAECLDVS